MYTYIKKHFLLLGTILFLASLGLTSAIYLTSPESALPVQLTLVGDGQASMADVAVSRLSVNGVVKPLVNASRSTTQATFSDVAQHVYYGGLRVSFSTRELAALRTVTISIGTSVVRYDKQRMLEKWSRHTGSDSLNTFDYTGSTADERIFGKPAPILNADVSGHSFLAILANRLPFLLILLFVGFALTNKLTVQNTSRWSQRPALLSILFTLTLLIYKLPYSIQPVGFGLDPSWITALNWAQYKELNWGEDLAFTYGPYFWLLYPGIVASQTSLIIAFWGTALMYGGVVWVIAYYLFRGLQRHELSIVTTGAALLVLFLFEFTLPDIAILVPVLILSEARYRYWRALPVYGLMAMLALCKFSYLPVSACVVLFVSARMILQREWFNSILNISTLVICIVLLWWVSGQPVENFGLFLKRGYQIAGGYSEAMCTPFWNSDQSLLGNLLVNVALLLWAGIFIAGILVIFAKACLDGKDWFKIFLTAPVLFLAFKEGYVRMDFAHSKLFFSQLALVLIVYSLLLANNRSLYSKVSGLLALLLLFSLLFVDASHPVSYLKNIDAVFSRSVKERELLASKDNTTSQYRLTAELPEQIKGYPVDIIPYDISLLYAYNLNWTPRPVFQSYSAYTSSLDSINAAYIGGRLAPRSLLLSFSSIDNRYPLFDEPAGLRAMQANYQINGLYQHRFLLLKRLLRQKTRNIMAIRNLAGQLNAIISIPTLPNCQTYMYADLQLTTLGKLCNFLLKVQPPYLTLKTDGEDQSKKYRLVRQTANDGLLVSHIAKDIESVSQLMKGEADSNGKELQFIANPLLYKSAIAIRFEICANQQ